jgi:hypothetical protein
VIFLVLAEVEWSKFPCKTVIRSWFLTFSFFNRKIGFYTFSFLLLIVLFSCFLRLIALNFVSKIMKSLKKVFRWQMLQKLQFRQEGRMPVWLTDRRKWRGIWTDFTSSDVISSSIFTVLTLPIWDMLPPDCYEPKNSAYSTFKHMTTCCSRQLQLLWLK